MMQEAIRGEILVAFDSAAINTETLTDIFAGERGAMSIEQLYTGILRQLEEPTASIS